MRIVLSSSILVFAAGVVLTVSAAQAQEPAPPPAPPPAAAPAPPPPPPPAPPPPKDDGVNDHDRFIGHFAVGYFGISQLPIAGTPQQGPNNTLTLPAATVNAPVIGVRYWFQPKIGIDLGVGFGMSSGSTESVIGNQTTSTDSPSNLGFAFHAGVPLALAANKHFTWELVPEATIGFTSGTIKGVAPAPNQPAPPDTSLSGFRLDVGARAGAEIHFGFIGLPELALEGSVGLYVRRQAWKAKQDPNSVSVGQTTIGTTLGADPWALFVNQISALYYF